MTTPEDQTKHPRSSGMGFLSHLEELRWRLLKSFFSLIVMAIVAYYFSDYILEFLIAPLGDIQLHVTEVAGSFYAYLKISLFAGIVGASPIIFYQLWSFISPGLYKHEKKALLPLVTVSTLLFVTGAYFCYKVVLPISLKFLIGFAGDILKPIITVGSYLSFSGLLLLAFGFGFQLPILCYILGRMGIISASFLSKGRRYAVVILLIVGAIITPPDVFTQFMLAVPMYFLYEISIIVVRFTAHERKKKEEESSEDSEEESSVAAKPPKQDNEIGGK